MLGRTDSRARAVLLLIVFVVVAGALGTKLAYWQVIRRDELAAVAVKQASMTYDIPAKRGAVYDRTGTVVLATSVQRDRLAANPKLLKPQRRLEVANRLVGLLGLEGDAADTLINRMTSEREYVVLARGLDSKTSDRIRELQAGKEAQLAGLILEPEQERLYPQAGGGPDSSLAAHLLGFVNRDGAGQYGVEQYYQDELAGLPTRVAAQRDASGNPVPDSSTVLDEGSPGNDLILTIDASLQVAVEQELLAAWIADRAKRVSAVVLDPYTGEVYAYASYPSYDANRYQEIAASDPARFVDPVVSTVYEPGSVFKMMTAVAALQLAQAGTLRLDAPLGTYLRDYPNAELASTVTAHHLLTHTGGTGDIFGPEFMAHRLELRETSDYLQLYGTRGLQFVPGAQHVYSNYGFILLGALIEQLSGKSYYDHLAARVLSPAGMMATGFAPEDSLVPGRSVGYTRQLVPGALVSSAPTLPYRGTPAGGGYSTVGDFARFAAAVRERRLLDSAHTTLLLAGKVAVGQGVQYAYGFFDRVVGGRRFVGHTGGAAGMSGALEFEPNGGYVVVVLSNFDSPAATEMAGFILQRLPTTSAGGGK